MISERMNKSRGGRRVPVTQTDENRWLVASEQGKTEQEIADAEGRDRRTIVDGLDSARRRKAFLYAQNEAIAVGYRQH